MRSSIDYNDVQGLVRFGHGQLTEACFLLLEIVDRVSARAWLETAPVTTAAKVDSRQTTAVQVAFTRAGLEAIGVPQEVIRGFSPEFISGMAADDSRSRRLGDVGANAPGHWEWGGQHGVPHLMVMVYAAPGRLDSWKEELKGEAWKVAFREIGLLPTVDLGGVEHFGFMDGMSQPKIDWTRELVVAADELEYRNVAAVGEFLLGYRNEYGKYTDRPLVERGRGAAIALPPAEDDPDKGDVGRNGTYLVFRQLRQDVRGFWQFLDQSAKYNPDERRRLGESMVGRTITGAPLLPLDDDGIRGVGPDPGDVRSNQFTYQSDAAGLRCPLGAHVRRANPRNADFPHGTSGFLSRLACTLGFGRSGIRDDLIASTRFHRIVRRGREYGPRLPMDQALQPGACDDHERGLHFICLNANITRQFEFIQNAWVMNTKFDGLSGESDPLLGNREPMSGCPVTSAFGYYDENGVRRRINGMPQFVTVRGGAYFFLPGIGALRYLVRAGA